MSWSSDAEKFMKDMKRELGVITAQGLTDAVKGKNFSVRLPRGSMKAEDIDVSQCICGTSYDDHSKWSKCVKVTDENGCIDFEFSGGIWRDNAVPCFTDLYMAVQEKSGKKHAVSVKMRVRD